LHVLSSPGLRSNVYSQLNDDDDNDDDDDDDDDERHNFTNSLYYSIVTFLMRGFAPNLS